MSPRCEAMMRLVCVFDRYHPYSESPPMLLARSLVTRLAQRFEVEVLTTVAMSEGAWTAGYPPGSRVVDHVRITRFAVDIPGQVENARLLSEALHAAASTPEAEYRYFKARGPYSSKLLDAITDRAAGGARFVFFDADSPLAQFGLPGVASRALLVPGDVHPGAKKLSLVAKLLGQAGALGFISEADREMVTALAPGLSTRSFSPIVGVDEPIAVPRPEFCGRWQDPGAPYVFSQVPYASIETGASLARRFPRYRREHHAPLKLVLAGPPLFDVIEHPELVHVGVLGPGERRRALAHAAVVIETSAASHRVFSCLEAWSFGASVLADGRVAGLGALVREFQGGLWYESGEQFIVALHMLIEEGLAAKLGAQGRERVLARCRWDRVLDLWQTAVESLGTESRRAPATGHP